MEAPERLNVVEIPREQKEPRFKKTLISVIAFVSPSLMLVLWELLARYNVVDVRLFSCPTLIMQTLIPLVKSGELFLHLAVSAQRILLGFLCGALPGIALGLTMGLFPPVRAALMPIVSATFPIPKLAIMPLILIVFGLGEASKVFTIAIGVFYLVLINTLTGVMNISQIYLDVARNFGATRWQFYRTVALPGALPMVFAGLKLGMGTALLLIVAAELSAAQSGVGWMVWRAYDMFDIERMFSALITLAVLGYVLANALEWLERRVIPWRGR